MSLWTVRPAAPGDLDAVVATFLACWRVNYGAAFGPLLTSRMDHARGRALWEKVFAEQATTAGEKTVTLVAVAAEHGTAAGQTCGPSIGGVTRFERIDHQTAEVHSLYVSPQVQGAGLGRLLLTAACERACDLGATQARLWVFANNEPSLGFYRSQGWSPDGTKRVQPEFGEPEVRLRRTLGSTAASGSTSTPHLTKAQPGQPGG